MLHKLTLSLLICSTVSFAQEAPAEKRREFSTGKLLLHTQRIPESLPTLEVTGAHLTTDEVIRRAHVLTEALNLPIKDDSNFRQFRESKSGAYRLRTGSHKIEIYPESGGTKYQNTDLYRLEPKKTGETAQPDNELMKRAELDLGRLASAGLISLDQLDRQNIHISHQRTRTAERREGGVRVGELSTIDSRIDFTRRLGDLRIAGNGVRLIYGNDGKLYGCEIVWRSLQMSEMKAPLAVSREGALTNFQETVEEYTRLGSRVELLQAELVYVDPGPGKDVSRLESTYLFLYRVLTPIAENKDEFIVGKKLFYSVPALKQTSVGPK